MALKRNAPICAACTLLLACNFAFGLIETLPGGFWPADWPQELEPLRARDQSRTIHIGDGTQENIYEITFADHEDFEKAWPAILSLKTPGAPMRIYKAGSKPVGWRGQFTSNAGPIVRIIGPTVGYVQGKDGEKLMCGGPWPKDIVGPNGELPEFVVETIVHGKMRWIEAGKDRENVPSWWLMAESLI